MRYAAPFAVLAIFLAGPAAWAQQGGFTFQSFLTLPNAPNSPSGGDTEPLGINDRGRIVGYREDANGIKHGFLYASGTTTIIDDSMASRGTRLSGINKTGEIVGSTERNLRGFSYARGRFTPLTLPNGRKFYPSSVNNSGAIAGVDFAETSNFHGVVLRNGHVLKIAVPGASTTSASAINGSGQVAGTYTDAVGEHGFLLTDGLYAVFDMPGAPPGSTRVNGLNNAGTVVGTYGVGSPNLHGFVEHNGHFTTVDYPGSAGASAANAINDHGVIVGDYTPKPYQAGQPNIVGFVATPN